jgi:hypothetical protein
MGYSPAYIISQFHRQNVIQLSSLIAREFIGQAFDASVAVTDVRDQFTDKKASTMRHSNRERFREQVRILRRQFRHDCDLLFSNSLSEKGRGSYRKNLQTSLTPDPHRSADRRIQRMGWAFSAIRYMFSLPST